MRISRRRFMAIAPAAAVFVTGCSNSPTDTGSGQAPPPPAPGPQVEVTIAPLPLDQFDAMLARHKGKVVVVDFWFKGCVPCQEGMPHLVEMQNRFGKDKLAVVTMDIEDPDNQKGRSGALEFLKSKKITLINYVSDPREETNVWTDKFNFGQFPMTLVYDREGKLAKQFEGPHLKEIEELVSELVSK